MLDSGFADLKLVANCGKLSRDYLGIKMKHFLSEFCSDQNGSSERSFVVESFNSRLGSSKRPLKHGDSQARA